MTTTNARLGLLQGSSMKFTAPSCRASSLYGLLVWPLRKMTGMCLSRSSAFKRRHPYSPFMPGRAMSSSIKS